MADGLDPSLNWMQSLPGGLNSWTAAGGDPFALNSGSPFPMGSNTLPSSSSFGNPALPSGSPSGLMAPSTGGNSGGQNAAGAIGALAPMLVSLLGSSNPAAGNASASNANLTQLAQSLFGSGQNFLAQGDQALTPVLKYLQAVAGGDPGALLGATAPQRARVIDQYDTAKRSDQFLPRGGGQVSSTMARDTTKAAELSGISAEARTAGVNELGTLGANLAQLGVSASAQGLNDLNASIQNYEQQAQFAANQNKQTGSAIGSAVASAMPFILAALA